MQPTIRFETWGREDKENKADERAHRSDDKTAEDYQLEGGATLHLVLALRGGC